jgi:hypothetical protein
MNTSTGIAYSVAHARRECHVNMHGLAKQKIDAPSPLHHILLTTKVLRVPSIEQQSAIFE